MADGVGVEDQKDILARLQGRQQLIVLTVLITAYAALPVAMAIDFVLQIAFGLPSSTGKPTIDVNPLIAFAGPLVSREGGVLEVLHKLVLPLAALFLGANATMLRNSRLAAWLFLIPLAGTLSALLAASLLDAYQSNEVMRDFAGLPTLFRDIASNLGIVMMLLIGLSLGKQP